MTRCELGVALTALCIIGCSDPATEAKADEALLSLQLVQIAESLTTTADLESAYLSHFSEDAVLIPSSGREVVGKAAILQFYSAAFQDFDTLTVTYTEPDVIVDGDLAVRRYSGDAVLHVSGSDETVTSSTNYVDVLARQPDGRWLIIWHTWSSAS